MTKPFLQKNENAKKYSILSYVMEKMYFRKYGKLMYDISKKLTENGENDEKPKFVENFMYIFFALFLS